MRADGGACLHRLFNRRLAIGHTRARAGLSPGKSPGYTVRNVRRLESQDRTGCVPPAQTGIWASSTTARGEQPWETGSGSTWQRQRTRAIRDGRLVLRFRYKSSTAHSRKNICGSFWPAERSGLDSMFRNRPGRSRASASECLPDDHGGKPGSETEESKRKRKQKNGKVKETLVGSPGFLSFLLGFVKLVQNSLSVTNQAELRWDWLA